MASLTVRKLDSELKALLRLRAARHGRSVEDEVRTILADVVHATPDDAQTSPILAHASPGAHPVSPRVLLIVGGGIAAYKALDLIRRLKDRGYAVRVILTEAAQKFVTPLAAGALAGGRVFTDLFDPAGEFDVGHIRLARDADLILVAPATADLIAKAAQGHADDLASAVLLAASGPRLFAPAMNPFMWMNAATRRNIEQLQRDGAALIGPEAGEMAERGEAGIGRMAEPLAIASAAAALLRPADAPLAGRRVLVTSGPTHEALDPVRYIANRSSGKQGHAIAAAAAEAGAAVTLVSGPVSLPDPPGVTMVRVENAREMLAAVEAALPADVAIFAAAVGDWRPEAEAGQKIKKGEVSPTLSLTENPDILAMIAHRDEGRPELVIGFAAETERVVEHATEKRERKRCDWIVANDVSAEGGVMGGESNTVHLITGDGVEHWPTQSKEAVATALMVRIAETLALP